MAQLDDELDLDSIPEGRGSFDPIPAGWYMAQITSSEVAVTKNGQGKMLKLRFDIMEGEFENRVVFDQPCYQHTNAQTQLIAQQRLKDICTAGGHQGPFSDSEVLHYHPMMIKVGIRVDKTGQYEPQNEVKAIKACGASTAPAMPTQNPAKQTTTQAPAATATATARPWGNRAAR